MIYNNLFWDWNGTILDDAQACVDAVNVSLNKRGMREVDINHYREKFRFPVSDYYVELGFDFEKESYESIADEYTANYLLQKPTLRKGAKKTLEKLFLNSVSQYVLSACEKKILNMGIRKFDLGYYFKDIIALNDNRAGSKVEVGREYIATHNLSGKTLLVGDTVHDAEVAAELNMDCVLIESGYNSLDRLKNTGAMIITELGELVEIVLGARKAKRTDYMTPEKAERRSFDLSETDRKFKESYRSYYNDVKNTNQTEDW